MTYVRNHWSLGVEYKATPSSIDVAAAKDVLTAICDDLIATPELPSEVRFSDDEAYVVEWYTVEETLVINHFFVSLRGDGLGSHLLCELHRVASQRDLSVMEIWIGANEDGTEEFLTSNGFEWDEEPYDETHGRTLAGHRKVR